MLSNLRRLDLNLLLTLDVLLTEQNVTRAAQRLNVSQPTVSVQLARLREILGDPLLLPGRRGMSPTKRALGLRQPLRLALESLERAVALDAPFEPETARDTWRVAASDYGESTIILPSLATLRKTAPNTRLAVVELAPARLLAQAESGEIDLAFHITSDAPDNLRRRALFAERYVLVGRADHPHLRRRPTIKQFCSLEHVIVSPSGGGFQGVTDEVLAQSGLSRNVVLSLPHFLFVISALQQTNLVAMLPARLVRTNPLLRTVEAPVNVPGYEMCMLWHERAHRDPAHRWLREQIASST